LTIAIVKTWEIMCERYQLVQHHMSKAGSMATTNKAGAVTAMAVMITMESSREKQNSTARFDTDATTIGVDNRCTACILDKREHFMGNLISGQKVIKGFHGSMTTDVTGTIPRKW
jgi:hypothetical protein